MMLAQLGSLPQFHDVPVAEHTWGGDLAGAQVKQAQPGTRFALTDDNGVVTVLGAAAGLLAVNAAVIFGSSLNTDAAIKN